MAEEHRCQAPPEGPRLCANNCGFFGSPATLGLCSKCYRDHRLKEDQEAAARMAVAVAAAAASRPSSSTAPPPPLPASVHADAVPTVETNLTAAAASAAPSAAAPSAAAPAPQPGRCTACRKRVGLTGFRCRCGEMYCGSHRYPEQHGCAFDFKSAGRDAIARSNPVVKAHKLDKI